MRKKKNHLAGIVDKLYKMAVVDYGKTSSQKTNPGRWCKVCVFI